MEIRGMGVNSSYFTAASVGAAVLGLTTALFFLIYRKGKGHSITEVWTRFNASINLIQRNANDSSLNLGHLSCSVEHQKKGLVPQSCLRNICRNEPLLGDTLVLSLLVKSSPGLGPHQLSGLLSLVNHALALWAGEDDDLKRLVTPNQFNETIWGSTWTTCPSLRTNLMPCPG